MVVPRCSSLPIRRPHCRSRVRVFGEGMVETVGDLLVDLDEVERLDGGCYRLFVRLFYTVIKEIFNLIDGLSILVHPLDDLLSMVDFIVGIN